MPRPGRWEILRERDVCATVLGLGAAVWADREGRHAHRWTGGKDVTVYCKLTRNI